MSLRRLDGWERVLSNYLQERSAQPFVWGENDCCLLCADWIVLMTGQDIARDVRGTYDTADGAGALIARAGGLSALLDDRLGRENRVRPLQARRGDVVLIEGAAGLVDDSGLRVAVFFEHDQQLRRLPLKHAAKAWRVG